MNRLIYIGKADVAIKERACEDEDIRLLMSLLGVDVRTALLLKSEIGLFGRFLDYECLVSWAGLAPCVYQSGDVLWNGGVSRCGLGVLWWAIVEAAHVAVCCDERFGEFYGRVKVWCGGLKVVVVVGNKVLKVVWVVFVRRGVYGGVNKGRYEGKLNSVGFDL